MIHAATSNAAGLSDTYGIGLRAISLGGAFTALADDYSAAYYNPAGLGQLTGHQFALEYFHTSPGITAKKSNGDKLVTYDSKGDIRNDPTESSSGQGLSLGFPIIGLVLDINRIVKSSCNMTLGVAASLPEHCDIAYRIHSMPPDQPHFIRYGDNIDRITVVAGAGIEAIKDLLYLGGGVQLMLFGPVSFYVDGLSLESGNVQAKGDLGPQFRYNPILGGMVTPFEKKLKIGASWRQAQELDFGSIPVYANVPIGGLMVIVPLKIDAKCFYVPEEYSVGIAVDLSPFTLSVELNRQLWSNYRYTQSQSAFYSDGADFKDTLNYRMGLEYKLSDTVSILSGYYHQSSPVPNQSGKQTNFLDFDKDVFSLGASFTKENGYGLTKGPLTFTGTIQYQKLKDLDINKDGVTGVTWTSQESYTVKGSVLSAGVSVSVKW